MIRERLTLHWEDMIRNKRRAEHFQRWRAQKLAVERPVRPCRYRDAQVDGVPVCSWCREPTCPHRGGGRC